MKPRNDFLKQLQPLCRELRGEHDYSSDIAPGPRKARDQSACDRIPAQHDDGNRAGRLLGGSGPPRLHEDILTLGVPGLT